MRKNTFISMLSLCLIILCPLSSTKELKIGDQAPNFSLVDQNGTVHTLQEYKGKKVALYFYPKDGSPYCTKQACSVRDSFADLEEAGITVLGISSGSLKQKQHFAQKYHLSFPLLVATEKVLRSYGVKGLFFVTRKTILINEEGIIVGIIKNVDVKNNAQQIINGFKNSPIKSHSVTTDKQIASSEPKKSAVVYLHEQQPVRGFNGNASSMLKKMLCDHKNAIVIFYEDWCGPCKRMTPIFEELAQETTDIIFIKVKREFYRSIFDELVVQPFQQSTVPAILFFRNGILCEKQLSSTNKKKLIKIMKRTYDTVS